MNINTAYEYKARLNRVILFINRNLAEDISLDALADISGFSKFHFHRIFSLYLGERPGEFITRLRCEKSANLIITNPELSVKEVCYDCGFSSPSSFNRAFKKRFGLAPGKFRDEAYKKSLAFSKISKQISNTGQLFNKGSKSSDGDFDYLASVNFSQTHKTDYAMKIEVEELPAHHCAYVMHIGPYNECGSAWERICQWAGPRGFLNQDSKMIGVSFDDPDITDAQKLRYFACLTVPKGISAEKDIELIDIKGGKYAVANFEGKDFEIKQAYKDIFMDWLPKHGFVPDDAPCYELYLNDHEKHPEKKFVMNICVPVRPM